MLLAPFSFRGDRWGDDAPAKRPPKGSARHMVDLSSLAWLLGPVLGVLAKLAPALASRLDRLAVEVHRADVPPDPRRMAIIRLTNRSARDVVVTRIWFDVTLPSLGEVVWVDEARKLPTRLQPGDRWETFWALENLDPLDQPRVESLALVQLSTGKVFRSRATRDVAPYGALAG